MQHSQHPKKCQKKSNRTEGRARHRRPLHHFVHPYCSALRKPACDACHPLPLFRHPPPKTRSAAECHGDTRRYSEHSSFDIRSTASSVCSQHSKVDILVHAVANSPEVQRPLLDTTRHGYLAAQSASSFSFLSMLQEFGHIMPSGACALTLSYAAANRAIPGWSHALPFPLPSSLSSHNLFSNFPCSSCCFSISLFLLLPFHLP